MLYKNLNYYECYYFEIFEEDYEGKECDVEFGFYENVGECLLLLDKVVVMMF